MYTRSGVTQCTLFLVLYLCRMYRCGLHATLWLRIGTLMRLLAGDPCSTTGLLFLCQYLSGMIMVTPYSMVKDWHVSIAGPIPFYWPSWSLSFCLMLFFPLFSLILWVGIVELGSSDWYGVNRSLPALHCQPFLIIIIIIIVTNLIFVFIKFENL